MLHETSAAQRALCTTEILEIILVLLGSQPSPSDLLRAQLVSTHWYHLISASYQLQRCLYLRPDKIESPKPYDPQDRPRSNLLLRRMLQGRYPTMTINTERFEGRNFEDSVAVPGKRTSDCLPCQSGQQETREQWAWDVTISFPAATNTTVSTTSSAITYETASWKQMYLTQPPCTVLYLTRGCQRDVTPVLERKEGITMGTLMQAVREREARWNEGWLGLDGDWHFEGEIHHSYFNEL